MPEVHLPIATPLLYLVCVILRLGSLWGPQALGRKGPCSGWILTPGHGHIYLSPPGDYVDGAAARLDQQPPIVDTVCQ